MARDAIALQIDDISTFARTLRARLASETELPGHLGFLNHIARAGGFRNYQHLRSRATGLPAEPPAAAIDEKRLARALRLFDAEGRMIRWPGKTSLQGLCLWTFWARLPARQVMSEAEVNAVLERWHVFGDRAILRRSLIDHGLAGRRIDGSDYRRIERAPPPEARELIRRILPRGE